MKSHLLLKTALSGLSLDLEQELKRYSRNQEDDLPEQLATVNQDPEFIASLIPDSITNQSSEPSAIDIDAQDWELSYLFDDFSSDLSTDLENSLDEEFQDQIFPKEFVQTTVVPRDQSSEEAAPNLLSPMGIIAMIILLITSTSVGYLLVDPSGLNRLIKQDPNSKTKSELSTGSKAEIELFQTSAKNKKEPIPFVDFSLSKSSAQKLSKFISPFLPPIDNGRSFEPPIRIEPEEKRESEPVAVVNPKLDPPKQSDAEKANTDSKLDPEPTLSYPEVTPDTPNSALTPSSSAQISPPKPSDSDIPLDTTKPNPVAEDTLTSSPDSTTNPNSGSDIQEKPEGTKEVN